MTGIQAALCALLLQAGTAAVTPGQAVTVLREGARLMKAPRFFGAACGPAVAPGATVRVLELQKGWARIAAPGNGACWLHETAWSDRKAGELSAGGATSSRDVELAGRGFSEAEEARYRGEHAELSAAAAAVEAHLARGPEATPAEVTRFMIDGRLGGAR
jgi:hypothetical protein